MSPIDVFSDDLAWMHMILLSVAAPLLVAGSPFLVSLWAMPLPWRRAYGALKRRIPGWLRGRYILWQPILTWSLFALTLWVWHIPRFYEATLYHERFHDFQHFSFVAAAYLFWRVLLDPVSRLRLGRGAGVLYLFLTSLHATLLGVFMTIAPRVWYPFYESPSAGTNFSCAMYAQSSAECFISCARSDLSCARACMTIQLMPSHPRELHSHARDARWLRRQVCHLTRARIRETKRLDSLPSILHRLACR